MSARTLLAAIAAAACVTAPALMQAGAHSPARVAAALVLFGVAPGAALLPLLRRAAVAEPALVVATSLAVSAVVAQAMLWVGWSPRVATWVVAGLSLLCLCSQPFVHRGRA